MLYQAGPLKPADAMRRAIYELRRRVDGDELTLAEARATAEYGLEVADVVAEQEVRHGILFAVLLITAMAGVLGTVVQLFA